MMVMIMMMLMGSPPINICDFPSKIFHFLLSSPIWSATAAATHSTQCFRNILPTQLNSAQPTYTGCCVVGSVEVFVCVPGDEKIK